MKNKPLLFIVFGLIMVGTLTAVNITGPSITPIDVRKPTTEDILICSWNPSPDTTSQNVTWYNGTTQHSQQTGLPQTTNTSVLAALTARKGEPWTCNVSITNGTHSTWSSSSITIKNALPSPPNATDMVLYEDRSYTIPLSSTDPDGDSLTFGIFGSDPAYCTINPATGVVSCLPLQEHVGSVQVTFIVSDGGDYIARTNVTYTVIEVNDPPAFSPPLTDQDATEEELFNYSLSVTDEENHWPVTFSIESNLTTLIIEPTSDNQAYITFNRSSHAPLNSERGLWYVTVNITDSGPTDNTPYDNPTTIQTFYLTVHSINRAPNITTNLSLAQGVQGELFTLYIEGIDPNEGDTLTFSITPNCSLTNPWVIDTTNSSHNAVGLINMTLTNDHIVCREVNVSLSDGELNDWVVVVLNLTNINDPPVIHEISNHPSNTHTNMSNITWVKGREITYYVNATDPDLLTYEGDVLTYEAHTSRFTINSTTGRIQFTPQESDVGSFSVLINVSDSGLGGPPLWDARNITFHIINNTPPTLHPIGTLNCTQGILCTYDVTAYDPDPDETLVFSDNSTLFNLAPINSTASRIIFTPIKDDYGIHLVNISVTDTFGFSDYEVITINVSIVNDPPYFDGVVDFGVVVQDVQKNKRIDVIDEDVRLSIERNITPPLDELTYNWSFVTTFGGLEHNFSIVEEGVDYFIITFTPNSSHVGDHVVNLSVSDSHAELYWQTVSFTVLPKTSNPVFMSIRPHHNGTHTLTGFGDAALFPERRTSVSFLENTTVIFDALVTNDSSIQNNSLNYYWYVNNVFITSFQNVTPGENSSYNHHFGFFDEGEHTLRLLAIDTRYASSEWTWELDIIDVNRPPVLVNPLPNITLNTTTTISDYFSYRGGYQRFYDPDDDLDENGLRGEIFGEPTSLTYSLVPGSICSQVSFTFGDDDLSMTPSQVGTCIVKFRSTDPGELYVDSNEVWITVTEIVQEEVEVRTSTGGTSNTQPQIVPIPFEEPIQTPVSFKLLFPQHARTLITHIEVPIVLSNTWNETLRGITLSASTTANQLEGTNNISLDVDHIAQLREGENETILLTIKNYRIDEPFSVTVEANVHTPEFSDTAVILINTLERADAGDNMQLKITFARDLLDDNPVCQELNELLDVAEKSKQRGDYEHTLRLINTVVEGCRYLVNNQKVFEEEQPRAFYTLSGYLNRNLPATVVLGTIIVVLVGFGISMIITARKNTEEL